MIEKQIGIETAKPLKTLGYVSNFHIYIVIYIYIILISPKDILDLFKRHFVPPQELEAISKAQAIISGGAVSGSAKKHLPSLLPLG